MSAEELVELCQTDLSNVKHACKIAKEELAAGDYTTINAFKSAGYEDLALFAAFFLGDSNMVQLEPAVHHHAFYSAYQSGWGDTYIDFIAPRHSAKTTCGMKIPAIHGVCYFNVEGWKDRDPQRMTGHPFTIISSASKDMASKNLTAIKAALEFSPLICAAFAHPLGKESLRIKENKGYFKWNEDEIVLANGAQIVALGRGSQLRGFSNHMNFRPTLFIGDDLEGEKNVTNDMLIEDTRVWLYNVALPGVMDEPSYSGRVILLGTIVHDQCLVNHMKMKDNAAKGGMFNVLEYRMIIKDDDGNEHSLWPAKNSLESIYRKRARYEKGGRLNSFLQEYMNIAMSREERPFKPDQIQYYNGVFSLTEIQGLGLLHIDHAETHDRTTVIDIPEYIPVNTYIGVDFASSEGSASDFTAMVVIGVDAKGNCFLLDYIHARIILPSARWEALASLVKKYGPVNTIVESIGDQNATFQHFREKQRFDDLWFRMHPEKHYGNGSKIDRITGTLEPRFNYGAFFFKDKGQAEAIQEFSDFPQADHDDFPDATEMAVRYSRRCPHEAIPSNARVRRERDEVIEYDALTAA